MSHKTKHSLSFLLCILLISLIVRVAFCMAVPIPIIKDSSGYNRLALSLLSGYGLSYDRVNPTLFRGPIYPLFLAGIYSIFGYNPVYARLVQSLAGAIMCLIFYYISKQCLDELVSRQVAWAVAFHPVLVALSSSLISELLFTVLLGLGAIFLTYGFIKKYMMAYFISGVLFGITTLTRSITAYFAPFLLCAQLVFYKNKKLVLGHIALFLCGQFLIILPWTARNYIVSGQFCAVATGGGIALWLGTYTPGKGYDLGMNQAVYDRYDEIVGEGQSYTTITNDKKLFIASIQNIKNDPIGYLLLIPVKFQRMFISAYGSFFNVHQIPLSNYFKNPNLVLQNPLVFLWLIFMLMLSMTVLIFGVIGLWSTRDRLNEFAPILSIIIYFVIFHIFTFSSARSGIPVLPFILIFSMVGFNSIFPVRTRI